MKIIFRLKIRQFESEFEKWKIYYEYIRDT